MTKHHKAKQSKTIVTSEHRRWAEGMCGPTRALEFVDIAAAILRMYRCGHPDLKRQDLVAMDQSYAEPVPVTRLYCEACGFDSCMAHQYHPGTMRSPVAEKLRRYNKHYQSKTNESFFDEVKRLIKLVENDSSMDG